MSHVSRTQASLVAAVGPLARCHFLMVLCLESLKRDIDGVMVGIMIL